MVWFKVDDGITDNGKVRRLRHDKIEAMGVWVLCGTWSSRNLTDGFVPDDIVESFDDQHRLAGRLVEVGLWERVKGDDEDGYQFHDWEQANPTKSDVVAQRGHNARKAALHRDPALVAAVRARDLDRCRYCAQSVSWRDRRSTASATYDHVEPTGPNSLDNVVIACRGCNNRKGDRTAREAGMRLLSPGAISISAPKKRAAISAAEPSDPYLDTHQIGAGDDPEYAQHVLGPRPDPNLIKKSTSRGDFGDHVTEDQHARGVHTGPPRRSRGDERVRALAAMAHSPAAHRILTAYVKTCTGAVPTDVRAALGPRIDGLLNDGWTDEQIATALAEWGDKQLAPSLLASVANGIMNGKPRNGSRVNGSPSVKAAVAVDPDELDRDQLNSILGFEQPPELPWEVADTHDHMKIKEWRRTSYVEWIDARRQLAKSKIATNGG